MVNAVVYFVDGSTELYDDVDDVFVNQTGGQYVIRFKDGTRLEFLGVSIQVEGKT